MTIARRIWAISRYAEVAVLSVVLLVAFVGVGGYGYWRLSRQSADSLRQAHIEMANWAKQQLPADSVIMTHYPYLVRFYSGRPVVQIPFDGADAIERVWQHYGVGTVVVPTTTPPVQWACELPRRQLLDLAAACGWEPVYRNSGVVVFGPRR